MMKTDWLGELSKHNWNQAILLTSFTASNGLDVSLKGQYVEWVLYRTSGRREYS